MKLSTAAKLADASQEEVLVTETSNGRALYIGKDMQRALGLVAGSDMWVGISDRTVMISPQESLSTPHSLKLHESNQYARKLRAFSKRDTPRLPMVRRVSDSITVTDGVAHFKY